MPTIARSMPDVAKISRVKTAGGPRLEITFTDGAHVVHDLAWLFEMSGPILEPLREQPFFDRVFLEMGALTWPNGFDLCPRSIRQRMQTAGELGSASVAAE